MPRELIPELHDCLKLTTLQHNFSDFDERFLRYSPKTRSWAGVLQHHCSDNFPAFPTDRETFLLHMADGIAANFSRHRSNYSGEISFVVHKLWNPNAFNKDSRLSNKYEIRELLDFYKTDPSFEDLVTKYEQILESRAEDAQLGKNVTSLLTHLILTGKFYRFFKTSSHYELAENEIKPSRGGITDLTKRKSKEWQMHLALCKVNFTQQPFRARDLNIFELLSETKQVLSQKYSDNILIRLLMSF